jgi:alpha-ketoglutarate-dependent taurine dioxygenase
MTVPETHVETAATASRWYGRDFPSIDPIAIDLTPAHLAALDELMAKIRSADLPFHAVTRENFLHPALDADLAAIRDEVQHGRGIVFIRGFPVDRYSVAEMETMFWGVGTHFGRGHSQSAAGDLMGHVQDKTDALAGKQSGRGYLSRRQLSPHTDMTEILAMLSLRTAREGGESVFASAMTIWDIVAAEHPEYLPIYLRGFPYHRRNEQADGVEAVTPYDVPVFSTRDGVTSCFYVRDIIDVAMRDLGRSYTDLERAALDFFEDVFARDEVKLERIMQPGEAVFLNNHEVLHGRRTFADHPEKDRKRLLFRLQLQATPTRPVLREMFIYQNKDGGYGIDPQPGKTAAAPEFIVQTPVPVHAS